MVVTHKRTGFILGKNVKKADTFMMRLKGLMFVDKMEGMDGLLLDPCRSIHNCFVRFPIDVVFISKSNKVVKIIRGLNLGDLAGYIFSAVKTLELPNGTLPNDIEKEMIWRW